MLSTRNERLEAHTRLVRDPSRPFSPLFSFAWMVLQSDAHIEWRSPDDALALDVRLVEDVFRRLWRLRHTETTGRHTLSSSHTPSSTSSSSFDPDAVFTKSDVLVALERCDGFLQKRPLLRMLHTSLACVSLEKEGASLAGFVRYRVKERTLSFAAVRDRLERIHARVQRTVAFEQERQEFTRQARAKSPWCVRDWKSVHRSPSQLYQVHVLSVKPKSEKQLEVERQTLTAVAVAVVNNTVQLCVSKVVTEALAARTRSRTERSSGRSARASTPQSLTISSDVASRTSHTRKGEPVLRAKARKARKDADVEARRRGLRLQIFVPAFERAVSVPSVADWVSASPSEAETSATGAGVKAITDGDDNNVESKLETAASADTSTQTATDSHRSSRLQLLLLATAEANGDVRIAEQLVVDKIARSGFQRALEQAKNLGLAPDDYWGLLKIWTTVYRSHTLQSLRVAMAPHT